jgi:hypothetical protein
MEKLDKKFVGPIRKVKDASLVPDDQWCAFLAKDNAFARVLPLYVQACIDLGCDAEQIVAVQAMQAHVEEWRAAHPEQLKNPDAKGERLLP